MPNLSAARQHHPGSALPSRIRAGSCRAAPGRAARPSSDGAASRPRSPTSRSRSSRRQPAEGAAGADARAGPDGPHPRRRPEAPRGRQGQGREPLSMTWRPRPGSGAHPLGAGGGGRGLARWSYAGMARSSGPWRGEVIDEERVVELIATAARPEGNRGGGRGGRGPPAPGPQEPLAWRDRGVLRGPRGAGRRRSWLHGPSSSPCATCASRWCKWSRGHRGPGYGRRHRQPGHRPVVGSVMAIAAAPVALFLGYGPWAAIGIALLAGGRRAAQRRPGRLRGVQPIVATLGMLVAGRGIALVLAQGRLTELFDPTLQAIGTDRVAGIRSPSWRRRSWPCSSGWSCGAPPSAGTWSRSAATGAPACSLGCWCGHAAGRVRGQRAAGRPGRGSTPPGWGRRSVVRRAAHRAERDHRRGGGGTRLTGGRVRILGTLAGALLRQPSRPPGSRTTCLT